MNKNTFLIAILTLLNICCTNSQEHKTDYYKQIFSLKNIEYEKIESFIIIEEYVYDNDIENNKRIGIVICNTNDNSETFTYSINLKKESSLKLSDDFDDEKSSHMFERGFIFQLAITNFKGLLELEKINPNEKDGLNYVITYFDKNKIKELREINLYDVVIKEQKK
ncbi:hypothetical protein QSV08_05945 [Maribacter sp. BPC-D8]|uniref:hypothetical protein n=1 Tax=Maribacter sp. BPC-D8 TaxID=3053613 RepID=UPI002B4816B5|nr:hypothetical protein [Maribacter sp. BPC-D8]WRI30784.1 hypothetical protein QSV08_05945 [Maribacter sp. BPC-D8]